MATAFKVRALYEYASNHEDDLPFGVGQIITVTDEEDAEWYGGEYVDESGMRHEGIFPRNFVEKYEPAAPPRPTRIRKKSEHAPALLPDVAPPAPAAPSEPPPPGQQSEEVPQEPAIASPPTSPPAAARSPPAPMVPVNQAPEPEPVSAPVPPPITAPAVGSPSASMSTQSPPKSPPPTKQAPPVTQKPVSNSFKDRIAAFNKPAAPPVAPFKPGGLGSGGSGFIKKPFVAPPPSRNAYVPPPQRAPTARVYRRDEDPEIKERETQNQEQAEKAGLAPTAGTEGEDADQPKPTSLKERIALLQKQQAEQAQRHAEAVAKKAKPKRPPPKRTESETTQEPPAVDEAAAHPQPMEHKDTAEVASKKSVDISRKSVDESSPPKQPLPVRRKSTREPEENDGNEADMSGAGDTTEGQEDLTEKEDSDAQPRPSPRAPDTAAAEPAGEVGEEDELEEEDPETKRREELRARMAKMSGGMGFHGMFGPPGMGMGMGAPVPPKKKSLTEVRRPSEVAEEPSPARAAAPPVPTMMALPGMGQPRQQEEVVEPEQGDITEQNATPLAAPTSPKSEVSEVLSPTAGGAPAVPETRPAPPPVPTQTRPPPPPPPAAVASPGSDPDDELSENPPQAPLEEAAPIGRAPPPPIPVSPPPLPSSPRPSVDRGATYFNSEAGPTSPPMSPQSSKRHSRPPPPIPSGAPPPTQSRLPPPPPPGVPSRASAADERAASPMKPGRLDNGEETENTEYEGDYDTDIASSAPHKDALKSHERGASLDDSTSVLSPVSDAPPSLPPPLPTAAAPMTGPPAVPSRSVHSPRASVDVPRAAPPPPPPPKEASQTQVVDDYDPYNYNEGQAAPASHSHSVSTQEEPQPTPEATLGYQAPAPPRGPPSALGLTPARAPPRQSLDVQRPGGVRRSVDAPRPSISAEPGFMANDIDLATQTNWWLPPNGLPPAYQGRQDIYSEAKDSTVSGPDGRTSVTKEIFILFQDFSQTVITIVFDPQDPSRTEIEQRHEAPPRTLRQDQLEQAYERYGRQITSAVTSKSNSVVGDGTPHGLVYELLKAFPDALRPVGKRAYGALVYANLANASTQMNDEIRPGDIVSFRNAKFSGKHGPMHAKYSTEVGKPDHVAIVAEWDGTKKKVRAWEQGRESKKCKQESFKLDDLRSGEVKVWRVMPRSWVGWSSSNSQD
ncbi:hypothetical protein DL766_006869 [Monosporascus sp. MC13-8B]|uniref:SH3 domain-containing protein n=1 Tax=Monosporascus cannonballus TaxID=155416 RepID=A0ABY0GWX5_9PEZI|nr:hypothetical protein DL762_008171 [Monosporascus cannonballus]RYO82692.1 hypothetical protein DL763_008147 [Monosporascus cannonballus]RYP25987.1 hypothetical protein DL766_006869 [Monosporascus sp. MC13-8B]